MLDFIADLRLYQILIPTISFLIILKSFVRLRKGDIGSREFIFWFFLWGFFALVAVYPETSVYIANYLGLQSNVNTLIFISIGLLFFLIFKVVSYIRSVDHKVTLVVRGEAIKNAKYT